MSLRASLRTARDLFGKLERDEALLKEEVTSDRFFNFVVTAHSLCDWIVKDPAVPQSAKAQLSRFRRTAQLKVCRDVANANKHFELDPKNQARAVTDAVTSEQGWGVGRWGVGPYGVGEEQITITLDGGASYDVLPFAATVVQLWRQFLSQHGV